MTHDEAYRLLPMLVELRSSGDDDAELRRHLAECATCRERLASLQRVAGLLRAAGDDDALPEPSPELHDRVLAIPEEDPRNRHRWRRRLVPAGVAAAVAASLVALALVVSPGEPGASTTKEFVAQKVMSLEPPAPTGVSGTIALAAVDGPTQMVRLKVDGLPTDGARTFDLWMMNDEGAVRVGSFGPDGDGHCVVDFVTPSSEPMKMMAITRTGSGPDQNVVATVQLNS